MAFSQLFRRYSTSTDVQSLNNTKMDRSSITETLLDELESQCRLCSNSMALQKRNSQTITSTSNTLTVPDNGASAKRHSSVDYSWLTPNNNLLHLSQEVYQLSEIIKMELSELIRNVSPKDCTSIINRFRREIRIDTKTKTPESTIAIFRKTISEYLEEKISARSNNYSSHANQTPANTKTNVKGSATAHHFSRNNRINPKGHADDEQHCIAELTEISISSSSNDGNENRTNLVKRS